MATKLLKKDANYTEVLSTLDGDAWKSKQDKALAKLAGKVKVQGFRDGKAPLELAKQHINPMDIINEAINASLDEMLQAAVTEQKVPFYSVKETKVTKVDENGLEVSFTVVNIPSVTLGKYKGLDKKLEKVTVTAEEIDHEISHLLDNEAELVLKETPAEMGDTVCFDFKGYIDGKEFDGGSAENYQLVLGSNQFIPGFEEQLVGATANSKIDVNVTFPEQYVKELAGKAAKFVCLVHEIKTKKLPELNDEFATSLGYENVKTVEDLKKFEEAKISESKTAKANETLFTGILADIVKDSQIEIAPEIIDQEATSMKDGLLKQIEQSGLTYEQYKEMIGLDEGKIMEQYREEAKKRLSEYLVIMTIGQVEKLAVSEEELEKYYNDVAAQYNMEVSKVKEIFAKNADRIAQNLYQNKVERFIIDANVKVAAKKTTKKAAEPKEEKAEAKEPKAKKTTKKVKEEEAK